MKECNRNVLKRAIRINGEEAQLLVAMEECAELIQAISHHLRKREPKNLIEEIADVNIMVHQLKLMFGNDEVQKVVDEKIYRLHLRLDRQEAS